MRLPWFILFCLLFPCTVFAQNGIITGIVTSADSKKPIVGASVFLSNSAVGTATNDRGFYTLANVRPGQYTLVVSILGFKDYDKTVLVGPEPIKMDIQMEPKPLELREVVISSPADWKKNYEEFRRNFIGVDANARFCEVQNPHILNITFNQTKETLHADADQFLIVENAALGYRIKFLVRDFNVDHINNIISSDGDRVFEELPGSAAQKKKWHDAREAVYYGSSMHFFRSIISQSLIKEGFDVYTLKRYQNPNRLSEPEIKRGIKVAQQMQRRDSFNYYVDMENNVPKWVHESLVKPALTESDIASHYDNSNGLFVLHFDEFLYVVYTKKRDETDYKDIYRPLDMPNYEISVISQLNGSGYPIFDRNGIVVGNGIFTEGTWTKSRLSDLLPVDYVPDLP
jgi:hypothetical protein